VAERFDTLPVTDRTTFVDHYVTRGQTLSDIARQYRVSVSMIQGANPSLRPRTLRVGQRLIIPMSGRVVPRAAWNGPSERTTSPRRTSAKGVTISASHRVRPGETASQIARRFGVTLRSLLDYNGLTMTSLLKPGQLLRIPPPNGAGKGQAE
jgi:membrane-bound lytic murein transglycosylase D